MAIRVQEAASLRLDEIYRYTGDRWGVDRADRYITDLFAAFDKIEVHGIAHITGGGFYENIPRSLAPGFTARLQREVSDSCLQYWGGMGFMNETPVSRSYRDVVARFVH